MPGRKTRLKAWMGAALKVDPKIRCRYWAPTNGRVLPRVYVTSTSGKDLGFVGMHSGGDLIYKNLEQPFRGEIARKLEDAGLTIGRHGESSGWAKGEPRKPKTKDDFPHLFPRAVHVYGPNKNIPPLSTGAQQRITASGVKLEHIQEIATGLASAMKQVGTSFREFGDCLSELVVDGELLKIIEEGFQDGGKVPWDSGMGPDDTITDQTVNCRSAATEPDHRKIIVCRTEPLPVTNHNAPPRITQRVKVHERDVGVLAECFYLTERPTLMEAEHVMNYRADQLSDVIRAIGPGSQYTFSTQELLPGWEFIRVYHTKKAPPGQASPPDYVGYITTFPERLNGKWRTLIMAPAVYGDALREEVRAGWRRDKAMAYPTRGYHPKPEPEIDQAAFLSDITSGIEARRRA